MKESSKSTQLSTFRHSIPPLETLDRMAASSVTRFPVVERGPDNRLVGMIGLHDLLKARELSVEQELTRERVLRLRVPVSLRKIR